MYHLAATVTRLRTRPPAPPWAPGASLAIAALILGLAGCAPSLSSYLSDAELHSVRTDPGAIVEELCSSRHFVVVSGRKRDVPHGESRESVLTGIAQELSQRGVANIQVRSHCKAIPDQICPWARPFLDRGLKVTSVTLASSIPPGEETYTDIRARCGGDLR